MHEGPEHLRRLQRLLDESDRHGGPHLRSIHRPARRLEAEEMVRRLKGMCLPVLATVSADGRPFTGPLDSVLHRGAFYFGTDPTAVRWRHLRRRPPVSAKHLPSEDWAVTVHGRAVPVSTNPSDPEGLRATILEAYGPNFASFLDSGPVCARIDAARMFAIHETADR